MLAEGEGVDCVYHVCIGDQQQCCFFVEPIHLKSGLLYFLEQWELFAVFLFCEKQNILWNGKENSFSFEDVNMASENIVKMWDVRGSFFF